jgi:hypothetical protein
MTVRNETFQNGVCVYAETIDLTAGTVTTDDHGEVVSVRPLTDDERRQYGPQPLDHVGALATLLAVVDTLDVDDAANAVGLTAEDLVAEAQAWAMGQADPLQYNVI